MLAASNPTAFGTWAGRRHDDSGEGKLTVHSRQSSYGLTSKRRQQGQRNSQCGAWPSPIGDGGWSASVLAHDGGREAVGPVFGRPLIVAKPPSRSPKLCDEVSSWHPGCST